MNKKYKRNGNAIKWLESKHSKRAVMTLIERIQNQCSCIEINEREYSLLNHYGCVYT